MPTFDQSTVSSAAPEEVWKLLYDPARFPEWWAGIGSVTTAGGTGDYTMFPDGYPDFPMPQALETSQDSGSVKISCLVSDLCFDWRLRPSGTGTEISVHVEIPDSEAHRLDTQRDIIRQSLIRLADLAAATA
ncbi:MAG TPA: SRPBCC family protein [Streptosporangiaceae bacterium]|nr:SRPBCC family protein [Streptosporangiaceae bacterium]